MKILFISTQFIYFLLTSGFAALVNFTSRILYNQFFDFNLSILLAFISGIVTAFTLAKLIVFRESCQKFHRSILFFLLINLIALAQTWLISMWLAYYVIPYFGIKQFVHEIAHAVGLTVPIFTSYIGHKSFSFK